MWVVKYCATRIWLESLSRPFCSKFSMFFYQAAKYYPLWSPRPIDFIAIHTLHTFIIPKAQLGKQREKLDAGNRLPTPPWWDVHMIILSPSRWTGPSMMKETDGFRRCRVVRASSSVYHHPDSDCHLSPSLPRWRSSWLFTNLINI